MSMTTSAIGPDVSMLVAVPLGRSGRSVPSLIRILVTMYR
jgi:hypothetical protein